MLNFRKMRYDVSPFPRGDDFRKPAPETEIAIGKWIRKPAKCKFALGARWKGKPIVWVPKGRMPKHLWFVGDIHGDILALETIIQTVNKETPGASIVFLGDMFDRHPYGYEVVIRLLELMKEKPCGKYPRPRHDRFACVHRYAGWRNGKARPYRH